MKTKLMTLILFLMIVSSAYAEDRQMHHHTLMQGSGQSEDPRISLRLHGPMRQHQLSMMREHLAAVRDIIADIAVGQFEEASQTARQKLGLTPEMKRMCNRFSNGEFRQLGLAFHESADELADVLQTRDMEKSLDALHSTMDYCVRCHSQFRQ